MTTVTTKTGNALELNGFMATIRGVTFEFRKTTTGIRSAYMVPKMGMIEMELTGSDLVAAHAHLDAAAAQVAAKFREENADLYMADRIHNGNGDAEASR